MWSSEQVQAMRQAYRDGAPLGEITAAFGGNVSSVHLAIRGVSYREIPGAVYSKDMRRPRHKPIEDEFG